ncbi:transcriptional regulator, PadR family [Streptomyces sp. WMMB 714]|jgi:DNA-binding PadR family transcriptional regulator|uniref:PadR family transcriptional regulator n=1 Tax=Streptomyces sp. WMMB 714 TaxID=1286822 RepID=UPI0005F7D6B8|nr:PadR family transcriptional regulator [Streptomyces sp. WMMB 714]SCK24359.1 transcriptional regulator, PadR family [Streptomyces sp. WMMB 714]
MTKSMQEPTFLVLTALADAPQHGYGIIGDVERISGGRVRLRAGTLYTALDRLQAEGLIESDHEAVVDGRLRRYYRLTDAGAGRLEVEVERMRANVTIAATRLRLRHGLAGGTA